MTEVLVSYIAIGPIASGVVMVVYTERLYGEVYRILSARPAIDWELQAYQEFRSEL